MALMLLGVHSVSTVVRMSLGESAASGNLGSITTVNKFGRNQDADTTEDSIWEGSDVGGPIRCFDVLGTTAAALYISSDHQDDAGLDVTVEYLDSDWDVNTITQTLGAVANGTATEFVQLGSETILRVNRAYATDTALTGNVYIHIDSVDAAAKDGIPDTILTDLVAVITAGENQTLQACYTVPNGFNALLTQFCTTNVNTAANAVVEFRLRKSVAGAASRVQELMQLGESIYQCTTHDPPIIFNEKTDIELTSDSSANNASATGTFDLILLPNTMR
jgi:hypothetical protein